MSLFNKLKISGIWQTLEVAVMVLSQFLYIAVMARILNKADFGLMAIANSFVAFGYIFAESGMGAALVQKKNITNEHISAAFQGGLLFGLILFFLFFSLSPLIANFFDQQELKSLIRVIALNILILSMNSVSLGILLKRFKFKEKSIVTIFSVIISYSVGIFLGIKGFGVWSLVLASLLLSLLQFFGYFKFAGIKILRGIFFRQWKDLFSFGFGIVLLKISTYIGSHGINLALGKIFTPSVLGVFERSYQIKTLPSLYLGNILDTIMYPAMSEIQDDKENLFRVYQYSLGFVNTLLMPIAFYLIYFSEEIVLILLGKDWLEAVVPLQIMFVVLPFSSSVRMADSVIKATGLVYRNALRKMLFVALLLLSASYGGYKYGLNGAAVGVLISFLFNYIIMLFLVRKIFNKSIVEIFLSPILAGLKISFVLAVILILSEVSVNKWITESITYFLILSVILGLLSLILLWRNPSVFGKYLKDVLLKLMNRR